MLRISVTHTAAGTATLHLEGQVAGPWTAELNATCERLLGEHARLTLDLGDVSLIDRPGLALLTALTTHRAVVLSRCSPFQEEQLRQAAASDRASTTQP